MKKRFASILVFTLAALVVARHVPTVHATTQVLHCVTASVGNYTDSIQCDYCCSNGTVNGA